jgi:hypothetical protein
MIEKITFRRIGSIYRGDIRVGWIEDDPLSTPGRRWKLRFTPASGIQATTSPKRYDRLKDAKEAARAALSHG